MTNVVIKEPEWQDKFDSKGNLIEVTPKDGDFRWKKYTIRKASVWSWEDKILKNQAWLERYDAKSHSWKRLPVEHETHYV